MIIIINNLNLKIYTLYINKYLFFILMFFNYIYNLS